MTTIDHRAAAGDRIQVVIKALQSLPATEERDALLRECTALTVAIRAFHMEGIRFRMFNVDRLLTRATMAVPEAVNAAFSDARRELEAAGFHTRSHQAPG